MLAALAVLALALGGCGRDGNPEPAAAPAPAAAQDDDAHAAGASQQDPAPVVLEDVIERDPRYIVGISFPPGASRYPGLAAALDAYARAARAELDAALDGLGAERPAAPYDLALHFEMLVETPRVVAVAADGSSYTGGAHGNPLVARFVWLPERQRMLTAQDLIAREDGWRTVSGFVREQLHAAFEGRTGAADLAPGDHARLARSGRRMIEEGTTPEPENFALFEPVMDPDGQIEALRFVFPPYQVGPYSDGTQAVGVPSAVLLPYLAEDYRELFTAG